MLMKTKEERSDILTNATMFMKTQEVSNKNPQRIFTPFGEQLPKHNPHLVLKSAKIEGSTIHEY